MPKEGPWLTYGRYGALGFEFAGSVIAGILLGRYVDGWLGTEPWAMILGAVGGLSGAVYRLILVLQQLSRHGHNS
jgi:F0F1-type ATP synthase assembly protein I